jgi:hypothetical protein
MKKRSGLLIVLLLMIVCFTGCWSWPKEYSFADNEDANGTAVIVFDYSSQYRLVDIDGVPVPAPERGTYWERLQVPAGRALNIRMYILYGTSYDFGDQPGFRRRGVLRCPPLETGKTYKLWYIKTHTRGAKSPHYSGVGKLVLTYADAPIGMNSYIPNEKDYIYVQEIPPLSAKEEEGK